MMKGWKNLILTILLPSSCKRGVGGEVISICENEIALGNILNLRSLSSSNEQKQKPGLCKQMSCCGISNTNLVSY